MRHWLPLILALYLDMARNDILSDETQKYDVTITLEIKIVYTPTMSVISPIVSAVTAVYSKILGA